MSASAVTACAARHWRIAGRVQGVGFRPFVYRLAHEHGLGGWVRNCGGEVEIHAEGTQESLQAFGEALLARAPPAARPHLLEAHETSPRALADFSVRASAASAQPRVHVPPDLFACDQCLGELTDSRTRRFRYPFINCTQCGPRYTIIESLPYDRANTSMACFALCPACAAEYAEPLDRRFHAEPLACAACGPTLRWQAAGRLAGNAPALAAAVAALRAGQIVAVRGIGGYHLCCDATHERAVTLLRERKRRPGKPFAVMVPWCGSDGLAAARALAELSAQEAAALCDPTRPIVLVRRRADAVLAAAIAPGLAELGLMLPYSPLHHLLLTDFGGALVATSC